MSELHLGKFHLDPLHERKIILVAAVLGILGFLLIFRRQSSGGGTSFSGGASQYLGTGQMGDWSASSGASSFAADLATLTTTVQTKLASAREFVFSDDYTAQSYNVAQKGTAKVTSSGFNIGATIGKFGGSLGFQTSGGKKNDTVAGNDAVQYAKSGISVTGFNEESLPSLLASAQALAAADRTLAEKFQANQILMQGMNTQAAIGGLKKR